MGRFENSATCTADAPLTCVDNANIGLVSALVRSISATTSQEEWICEVTGTDSSCAAGTFLENGNCKNCITDRFPTQQVDTCTADEPVTCLTGYDTVVDDSSGDTICEETGVLITCAADSFLENGNCK